MLIVLSPAKSLDYESPVSTEFSTVPDFLNEAEQLSQIAGRLSAQDLSHLMDISAALGELNATRFQEWKKTPRRGSPVRQAVFAFNGDVYDGLAARQMSDLQLNYLQKHVRILSGLYGVLRPMDQLQPYRLEMGTALKNPNGKNLYAFWGEKVTHLLRRQIEAINANTLINLASEEYFKVVKPKLLPVKVVTPIFQDWKNGQYKIISFFAKRARGMMARYCAEHAIQDAADLTSFNEDGYSFCMEESSGERWIFRRKVES
ncbi:peroxide stress protein YaaA [Undibacterium griseum]|uniref:UPF0246 protein H8K27_07080 n=1 Tax=Undibacterium griseum TaxID=2762295 RepID=A0ABR6YLU8_9BURK|nr:peroxide stress protein YaaA [Undibacterium griseum]MBC3884884.1 peroxide stress protein YaaA [Undibacterium griseum]